MSRTTLAAAVVLLSFAAALSAEERTSRTSRYEPKPPVPNDVLDELVNRRQYHVYAAEPVPDVMYKVEFRYIETRFQEGSDWRIYTLTESEDSADDAVLWIALHLIAEWRVTEYEPSRQWELVGTYDSQETAAFIADQWREDGYHTRIEVTGGVEYDLGELELEFDLGPGF